MLTARGLPFVCLPCRLGLAVSHARNAPSKSATRPSAAHAFLPPRSRHVVPRTAFHTSTRRSLQTQEHALGDAKPFEDGAVAQGPEESVRKARQLYGDALPRGHLSAEEFRIYERLYGTPVLVDRVDNVHEISEKEIGEDVVEKELPDGTTVLLKKNEDGDFEQVELLDAEDVQEEGEEAMTEAEWEAMNEENADNYHEDMYERSRSAQEAKLAEDMEGDEKFMRAHPLTIAGRFKPHSATVFIPKETFVDPVSTLLTRANHKHLAESANRIFGGHGLPHSASTAAPHLAKEQKPIPLDPSHTDMGNIESDVYLASVMPGTYATVTSTLVEVRRRLGTEWIERLLKKKGGPMVLDAGSGGAGILAWHEVLQAEWQRMHEESTDISRGATPLGKATVLAGSDTLRHRVSQLLENTTFIPRLPDHIDAEEKENTAQPRKLYDLIIAPHSLWPLRQEYLRKEQVEKYWSLLNPKGGVLIILEKGLPRGFEVVAAARQLLLDKYIASPGSTIIENSVDSQLSKPHTEETRFTEKETGMIIAPCTTHASCPMYPSAGISQGRKDFCYFSQRYIRPPYLQKILNAKDRNHEDVQFSYLAVQRGRDQRLPLHDIVGKGVVQNEESTIAAFEGHEYKTDAENNEELITASDINPLTLPRLVLPALKRRGHIILDVCTPAGQLERWTVPRSFSKQAFRDARKARWGDLWALGAKTRIPRNVRLGRPRDEFDKKGRMIKTPKKQVIEVGLSEKGIAGIRAKQDGRYTQDRKIRGSGGRKGRKKSIDVMQELDLD